jgi:hypothetical protein
MKSDVLQVANEVGLWAISIAIVVVVLCQALLYARLSFKVASKINYPAAKCKEAFRVGMITAIGPSIAVFIVMVGMMAVVGAPITWLRLAIIGAAPTELTASTVGAQAVGVQFGSPEYDLHALSSSFWTMTINGCGWLLITALFTHKLEDIRQKLGGGNTRWLALLSVAAALGCFGYLNGNTMVNSYRNIQKGLELAAGPIYATITGLISMILLLKIAQKKTWLREYTLGIAMLIGMFVAFVLQ